MQVQMQVQMHMHLMQTLRLALASLLSTSTPPFISSRICLDGSSTTFSTPSLRMLSASYSRLGAIRPCGPWHKASWTTGIVPEAQSTANDRGRPSTYWEDEHAAAREKRCQEIARKQRASSKGWRTQRGRLMRCVGPTSSCRRRTEFLASRSLGDRLKQLRVQNKNKLDFAQDYHAIVGHACRAPWAGWTGGPFCLRRDGDAGADESGQDISAPDVTGSCAVSRNWWRYKRTIRRA